MVITAVYVRDFIKDNKIPYMATQPKLCIPIMNRMFHKMSNGIRFDDIKVCDNLIIDGHHRYLTSLIAGLDVSQILSHKTSATRPIEWHIVELDNNDWDTPSKILYLNEQDAIYNGLDLEVVKQIASGMKK